MVLPCERIALLYAGLGDGVIPLTETHLEVLIVRQISLRLELTAESEESEGEGTEEEKMSAEGEMSTEPSAEMQTPPESPGEAPQVQPQGGRRTQLKIVRESVESLSRDVGKLRKSSEASAKNLEAHMKSLRKEFGAHTHAKDLGEHAKHHQADTKRLEAQLVTLRKELASFKSQMAKEAAKSRAREEAALARFAAKVKAAAPKKPRAKASKKKR